MLLGEDGAGRVFVIHLSTGDATALSNALGMAFARLVRLRRLRAKRAPHGRLSAPGSMGPIRMDLRKQVRCGVKVLQTSQLWVRWTRLLTVSWGRPDDLRV